MIGFNWFNEPGVQNVLSNQNSTLYYNNGQTIAYRLKDSKDTWNDIYVYHYPFSSS